MDICISNFKKLRNREHYLVIINAIGKCELHFYSILWTVKGTRGRRQEERSAHKGMKQKLNENLSRANHSQKDGTMGLRPAD